MRRKEKIFEQIKKAVWSAQHDDISEANLFRENVQKSEPSVCGAALVVLKKITCELGRKERSKKATKEKSPQPLWGSTECPQLTTCGLCRHLYICICMYMYMYMYMYICIYIHIYTCMYVVYLHTHTHTHVYMYICISEALVRLD
jgi:hypothetical protein